MRWNSGDCQESRLIQADQTQIMQNIPVQHGGGSMIRLSQAKRGAKKHDYIGNLFVKEEVVIMA